MTVKSLTIVRRRDGLSRADFRRYYEGVHAPLGIAWFGFDRYVRNHVVDDVAEPGFDCIAEFWPSDLDQIARALEAAGTIFDEDDARFMAPDRRGGMVEEHLLAGPPRVVDPPHTRKRIDLIELASLPDLAALGGWAQAEVEAGRADRIILDLPVAAMGNLDQALLHRWGCEAEAPPPGRRSTTARVDVCETPPAQLVAPRRP